MILLSVNDKIEQENIRHIIEELNINEKINSKIDTIKLTKKNLKKINLIITDYDEKRIRQFQSYKKEIIVYIKKNSKSTKKENDILYDKKTNTYNTKNELREILTYYIKKNKTKKIVLSAILTILALLIVFAVSTKCKFVESKEDLNMAVSKQKVKEKKSKKDEEKEKLKYENIVFLGDSLTDLYNLTKYYPEIPVINSGTCGFITEDVLENLRNYVYVYNPTKVFLLIGTNDISLTDNTNDEILANITKIVNEIHKYRPNTTIYVESLYPINNHEDDYEKIDMDMVKDRTNPRIQEINKMIKEYCDENKLEYINMYDELSDEDGDLKIEYTADGLHMTDEGYEVITKKIMTYIENDL